MTKEQAGFAAAALLRDACTLERERERLRQDQRDLALAIWREAVASCAESDQRCRASSRLAAGATGEK